jgi:hypothetical protein
MVDRLYIPIWNRTKKALEIALIGVARGLMGRDYGGHATNVQYKSNLNCHYEYPPYNEYILMKKRKSFRCSYIFTLIKIFLNFRFLLGERTNYIPCSI